jgi:hypothetical protein
MGLENTSSSQSQGVPAARVCSERLCLFQLYFGVFLLEFLCWRFGVKILQYIALFYGCWDVQ